MVVNVIGIIGFKGFIGSAMIRACQRAGHEYFGYGRNDIVSKDCQLIIDCNGNSRKFEVNQYPRRGYDSIVESVSKRLHQTEKNQKYIYLSSGEVYGSQQVLSLESDPINAKALSIYGNLKLEAEELIRAHREDCLIIRPSGFVGFGLLKNPIYDLMHSNKLFVHPESRFQFCDVDWFADTILWLGLEEVTGIWNVSATETISISEVSQMTKLIIDQVASDAPIEQHELSLEKLRKLIEIPTTRDVVKLFLEKFTR